MTRNDEIKEMAKSYAKCMTSDEDMQVAFGDALIRGAKWADAHPRQFWFDAHGDYLPEYEKEVIVLIQTFDDDPTSVRVSYGHRPDPKGWTGKSLSTGKIKHFIPKTYGKGGWNLDNVKVWLDIDCDPAISEPLKNVFKAIDNLVEDFMDACDNIVESKNKTK